jgi:hypothetical protein
VLALLGSPSFAPTAHGAEGSQGRFAGRFRSMIGTSYDSNGRPSALKGWSYVGGAGFDDVDDPELALVHFRKGRTDVVVFHSRPRSGTRATIIDVLTVDPVPVGRVLVPGDCTYDGDPRPTIIALARTNAGAALTRIDRAWYADRDRLRLSQISTKLIECESPDS